MHLDLQQTLTAEAVWMCTGASSWLRTKIRRLAAPPISKSRIVAFGSPNPRVVPPQVVRYLVPNRVGNHLLQLGGCSRHAFMWTLINRYPIRHGEALKDRASGQRVALVETEQARTGRLLLADNG